MASRPAYLICATPRTGSYLLCDGLTGSGAGGRPTEYLSPSFQLYWAERWGTKDYGDYLDRARAAARGDNGVVGVKTHPHQLTHFLRQVTGRAVVRPVDQAAEVERWLPGVRYVWLRRSDWVAQAVSYARSAQSHVWWDAEEAPAPFGEAVEGDHRFEFGLVDRAAWQLRAQDDFWRVFFRAGGIRPLVIDYADVVADRRACVEAVLDHAGVRASVGELPEPRLRRQADGRSARWAERYRELCEARRERNLSALAGIHPGATFLIRRGSAGDPGAEGTGMAGATSAGGTATRAARFDAEWIDLCIDPVPGSGHCHYGLSLGGEVDADCDVAFGWGPAVEAHPFGVPLARPRPGRSMNGSLAGVEPEGDRPGDSGDLDGLGQGGLLALARRLALHLGAGRILVANCGRAEPAEVAA